MSIYNLEGNPYFFYDKIEDFNEKFKTISKEVQNKELDTNFNHIIEILEKKEQVIYETLGGNINSGKENMIKLAKTFYTNNETRERCIEILNNLFNPKINIDGKEISFGIDRLKINGVPQTIDENTDLEKLQDYFTRFCNHWNESIQSYNSLLKELQNNMYKDGIIEEKSITTVENSFERIKNIIKNASNGQIKLDDLPTAFLEEKRRLAGMFSNLIGNATEGAKIAFEDEGVSTIINSMENFLYEHGDTIGNEIIKGKSPKKFTKKEKSLVAEERKKITGFEKDAKADVVFTLKGQLHTPEAITVPLTFKYLTEDNIKTHSGSLISISDIISKENNGNIYANYFRNLVINMVYWYHMNNKTNEDEIILTLKKILNKFAYSFIYGPGNNPKAAYGNAIFFCGFFKKIESDDNIDIYFLPVSKILRRIYNDINEGISEQNFPLNWAGFPKLSNFEISDLGFQNNKERIKMGLEEITKDTSILNTDKNKFIFNLRKKSMNRFSMKEVRNNILVEPSDFYNLISSKIGTLGITYSRKIITDMEGYIITETKTSRGHIIL